MYMYTCFNSLVLKFEILIFVFFGLLLLLTAVFFVIIMGLYLH